MTTLGALVKHTFGTLDMALGSRPILEYGVRSKDQLESFFVEDYRLFFSLREDKKLKLEKKFAKVIEFAKKRRCKLRPLLPNFFFV